MRLRRNRVLAVLAGVFVIGVTALGGAATVHADPTPGNDPSTSIVGGGPATQTYSFMVSLQPNGRHGCGGSLIASQWVVTAAHCVSPGSSGWQVRIGSTSWSSGGTLATVSQATRHPSYGSSSVGYDIALLKLSSPVSQAPVPLGQTNYNGGARLLGWGQTCPTYGCSSTPPTMLQQLDVQAAPDSTCSNQQNSGFAPATEICIVPSSGTSACWGDSGGPAIVSSGSGWLLIGATSRGLRSTNRCTDSPNVYTDVPAFLNWINQVTGGIGPGPSPTPTSAPPPGGCAGTAYQGSLSGTGSSQYQPNGSYYQSTSSGTHAACLDGPSGVDFDLYLQKWNGSSWSTVARAESSSADEELSYNGTAGYYRYRVYAYSGSGSYTLALSRP
ncbi:MAG: S1 family peptidase [Micromonosporaceae bacterium]